MGFVMTLFSYWLLFLISTILPICSALPWALLDLESDFDSTAPLYIRRSICSGPDSFYPSFITSVVLPTSFDNTPRNYTVTTQQLDPAITQTDASKRAVIFVWPALDQSSSSLPSLDSCGPDSVDRLCRVPDTVQAGTSFFDSTLVYRSNEFHHSNARLMVSKERVDIKSIVLPDFIIDNKICQAGVEPCLPYFMYVEKHERCQVGCRPVDSMKRLQSQLCNDPIKPKCGLTIDGKLLFGPGHIGGQTEKIQLVFPEFSPVDIVWKCELPSARKMVLCDDEPSGICDPIISVKKNGSAFFESNRDYASGKPGEPIVTVQIEGQLALSIKLKFTADMFNYDVEDARLLNGVYTFTLEFEGVSLFDPHTDGVPMLDVSASSNSSSAFAGFDTGNSPGCRPSLLGNDYQGTQDVDQCQPTRQCLPWNTEVMLKHQTEFPEWRRVMESNHTSCRNPPAANPRRARPWCYTGSSENDWAYCDVPFCDPAIDSPPNYDRFNRDCQCSSEDPPVTLAIHICEGICTHDARCQGYVYDETHGTCRLKRCRCENSEMTCKSQSATLYYRRHIPQVVPPIYPTGNDSVLFQVHNIEEKLGHPVNISCTLYWPKMAFEADLTEWQLFDESSNNFVPAPNGGDEATWIYDKDGSHQFILQIPALSTSDLSAAFKNRLYRCLRKGHNLNYQYEYHLIRVFGMPTCSVRFNQDYYLKQSFTDRGVRLFYLPDQYQPYRLQLDFKCWVDRPFGRCFPNVYWNDEVFCTPVVMTYIDGLASVNSLQSVDNGQNLNYTFAIGDKSFYLSLYFELDAASSQDIRKRELAILFYYPQLQQSHFSLLDQISTVIDLTALSSQFPSIPLVPVTPFSFGRFGMTCNVAVDLAGTISQTQRMTVAIHVPTPFVANFSCILSAINNTDNAFCFPDPITGRQRSSPCYPVSLILRKDQSIIYKADWESPPDSDWMDIRNDGERVTSPAFTFLSDKPNELILQMHLLADPIDLANVARREQLIMGSYSLSFTLDLENSDAEYSPEVSLSIIRSDDFMNNTGFCRPMIGNDPENRWAYWGFDVNSGRCSKRQCLNWQRPELRDALVRFKENWLQSIPHVKYEFSASESNNYCRNPSIDSLKTAPICAIGIIGDSNFIEWEYCDVPFCQDSALSKEQFRHIAGRCPCSSRMADGFHTMAGFDNISPVPEFEPGVEYCRKECESKPECLGFNYDQDNRNCELKSCQCSENEMNSPVTCPPSGYRTRNLWHYFNRIRPLVEVDRSKPTFIRHEIRYHPVQLGYSPLRLVCGLDISVYQNVTWTLLKDEKAYNFLNLFDKDAFDRLGITVDLQQNMAKIYKIGEEHDNIALQCSAGTAVQAHVIQVQQPPTCDVSLYLDPNLELTRAFSRSEYEIRLIDFGRTSAESGKVTAYCKFGNRKFGYCDGSSCDHPECTNPICNPEVKIFNAGTRIFRTSVNGPDSHDKRISLTWTPPRDLGENNFVNITLLFDAFDDVRPYSIVFNYLPRTQFDDKGDEKIAQLFGVASSLASTSLKAMVCVLLFLTTTFLAMIEQ